MGRKGEAPLAQIAKDFGHLVTPLKRLIAIVERNESGAGPAVRDGRKVSYCEGGEMAHFSTRRSSAVVRTVYGSVGW